MRPTYSSRYSVYNHTDKHREACTPVRTQMLATQQSSLYKSQANTPNAVREQTTP